MWRIKGTETTLYENKVGSVTVNPVRVKTAEGDE